MGWEQEVVDEFHETSTVIKFVWHMLSNRKRCVHTGYLGVWIQILYVEFEALFFRYVQTSTLFFGSTTWNVEKNARTD